MNLKVKWGCRMLSFVLLCFFPLHVHSATLRIATGEYIPFSGEKISDQGISTQVVKAIFKEMDQDITLEFLPWNRVMNYLKNNTIAGSYPWKESEERRKFLLFSEPITKFRVLLYMKNDNRFLDRSITKKNLCVPDGWDTSPYEELIKKYQIKLTKPINIESCFQMLALKRVDMLFLNEYVGQDTIKRVFGDKSPVKGVETNYFPKDNFLYFVMPKAYLNSEKIMAQFNSGLQKIKKNGIYNDIIKKHKLTRENSRASCETCNLLGLR